MSAEFVENPKGCRITQSQFLRAHGNARPNEEAAFRVMCTPDTVWAPAEEPEG